MSISSRVHRQFLCEFNETAVRVLVLERRGDSAGWEPAGFAERASEGFKDGKFSNLSDAAESLREAASRAARDAGAKIGRVTVSLEDPTLESALVKGSATMEKGEEGFSEKHVESALQRARQSMRPSDRHLVYQGISQYLIDDEYYSSDPVGIFGKELTVLLHLLFSDSAHAQAIRLIAARAGLDIQSVHPTAEAALVGAALPKDAAKQPFCFVVASPKSCHVARAIGRVLETHASFVVANGYDEAEIARVVQAATSAAPKAPVILTGEAAEGLGKPAQSLRAAFGADSVVAASTFDFGGEFGKPRFAVLAGLSQLRDRVKRPAVTLPRFNIESIRRIQMRAKTFVQEYF